MSFYCPPQRVGGQQKDVACPLQKKQMRPFGAIPFPLSPSKTVLRNYFYVIIRQIER